MTAREDLGPSLPPRSVVHAMAVECQLLARIAIDCSLAGHRCDLPRALAQLDKMRAVLSVDPANAGASLPCPGGGVVMPGVLCDRRHGAAGDISPVAPAGAGQQ